MNRIQIFEKAFSEFNEGFLFYDPHGADQVIVWAVLDQGRNPKWIPERLGV